ncbi:hypothetical protein J437_LFUL010069 [Ladona fulva]|uniref:Uncharacterized protein n=1 Tax=Ladona fulva TaxID=123851 RepID=A0A8K0K6U2_LADFU|nr:hypothetical protein J437_LFUL010069 [Ladona fulva]
MTYYDMDEEIKIMREESRALSEQIEVLENSIANNGKTSADEANDESLKMMKSSESEKEGDDLAQIDVTKQELDETRKALEQEKKEVLRRGKIILEYEESIKKLKEQASQRIEELQKAITEKERTEINMKTSFYQERRQNEILLNELTKLKWHENQLTQELNETLQQLSEYEMENEETEEAFFEHSHQLQQIENEVEKKTAQWYTYVVKLTQERDAAISTARSAREKLLVSLTEFQKHFAVQRKVQEVLTGMLRQREFDLKIALTKIVESRCIHSVADSNTSVETEV